MILSRSLALAGMVALALPAAALAQDREPPANSPLRAFEAKARKGMAYGAFRSQVLAAGWTAQGADDCAEAVSAKACKTLPELDRCTADGLCLMSFTHAGEDIVLRVATKGQGVTVDSWGFE
ncbi:hypothetical protein TPR58_12625 [Sphingomonas sp. HF-S3]|uniref:DUF4189 domain-containing protein n=1 Tax=Sphingomonas rustica TaxID=3103142 RepID=A0ABV0B9X4_9SPHN